MQLMVPLLLGKHIPSPHCRWRALSVRKIKLAHVLLLPHLWKGRYYRLINFPERQRKILTRCVKNHQDTGDRRPLHSLNVYQFNNPSISLAL